MSLGYAICSFHASYYQESDPHHQYLSLNTGEPVVLMSSSQGGGWIEGAVLREGLWKIGWLPLSHWCGDPQGKNNWLRIFTEVIGWNVYLHLGSGSHMANGSTTLIRAVRSYRQLFLSCHVWRLPTLVDDAIMYGMPIIMNGMYPIWRRWRLRVYHTSSLGTWLYPQGTIELDFRFWLHSIDELASVIEDFKKCGGYYEHLSFRVEEWSWDYLDGFWSQVDYR